MEQYQPQLEQPLLSAPLVTQAAQPEAQKAEPLKLENPVELTEATVRKQFQEAQSNLVEALRVLQIALNRSSLDTPKKEWSLQIAELQTAKLQTAKVSQEFSNAIKALRTYRRFK